MSDQIAIRRLLAVAMTISMFGCAKHTDFDLDKGATIHRITLTGFAEPMYRAGGAAGLTFVDVGKSESGDDFPVLMAAQNLHFGAELKATVANALRSAGYQVDETGNLGGADAELNVEIPSTLVYTHPIGITLFGGGVYQPSVGVRARLTDSKTHEILFDRRYMFGAGSVGLAGITILKLDVKYVFQDEHDLVENPKLAAEGLRAAEPLIAQGIASALMRPGS